MDENNMKEPQGPKPGKKKRIRSNMPFCGVCNGQMSTLYFLEDNKFQVARGFILCKHCNTVSKVVVTVLP